MSRQGAQAVKNKRKMGKQVDVERKITRIRNRRQLIATAEQESMIKTLALYLLLPTALLLPDFYLFRPITSENILFFDGVCNLCDGFVNFVADADPAERIRFGAIQKHGDLLTKYGAGQYAEGGTEALTTVVLVQDGSVYTKSTAALRVIALLDRPYRYLSAFYIIPTPIRDWGYKFVAMNRYRVFGKSEVCRAPSPRFQKRFLEAEDNNKPEFIP